MKNIHLIATDKPSRLSYVICTEKSTLTLFEDKMEKGKRFFPQNIYITSDEEIKEGWYFNNAIGVNNPVYLKIEDIPSLKAIYGNKPKHLEKIILTTDQDLDGVQAIDDDFLEWFVKNTSCENVEVRKEKYSERFDNDKSAIGNSDTWGNRWVIIISKEEPKQDRTCTNNCSVVCGECQIFEPKQETLEEASYNYTKDKINRTSHLIGFRDGAKWQQEQDKKLYSEEDMLESFMAGIKCESDNGKNFEQFIKQFKKK